MLKSINILFHFPEHPASEYNFFTFTSIFIATNKQVNCITSFRYCHKKAQKPQRI